MPAKRISGIVLPMQPPVGVANFQLQDMPLFEPRYQSQLRVQNPNAYSGEFDLRGAE